MFPTAWVKDVELGSVIALWASVFSVESTFFKPVVLRNFATDEVPTFSYSPFSLALEQKCWDLQNDKSPINEEAICVAEILEKG